MSANVAPTSRDDQPTTLYRLYDAGGRLLYVGIASDWPRRMVQHRRSKDWWWKVASTKLEQYASRAEALRAEKAAIKKDRPTYNTTHNREGFVNGMRFVPTYYRYGCLVCGGDIADGEGYFRTSYRQERAVMAVRDGWIMFRGMHAACDDASDGWGYCIEIAELRTFAQLEDWERHLRGKVWGFYTNLRGCVREQEIA